MGTIRFTLRTDKADKNGSSPVQLVYQISGERRYFKTKQKLLAENWNPDGQLAVFLTKSDFKSLPPRPTSPAVRYDKLLQKTEVEEINSNLSALFKEIKDIEKRFELNGVVYSPQMVINSVKENRTPTTRKQATSKQLFSFIDKYITDHQATRKAGSLKIYTSLKNHLQAFQSHAKKEISFESIDYSFFQQFQNFLIDRRGLNNTTVAKHLSTVKTFIGYARKHGIPVTDKYRDFKIKQERLEVIALTSDEFESLYNLDLSSNKKLDQVRDVFCFSCASGLRYSDLKQLDWIHINRDELKLVVTKTSESLTVPLNLYSQGILKKYKGMIRPLPVISNQKMNQYLKGWTEKTTTGKERSYKGLCELAGITEPVEIVRFRGAKRETNTYPKYELITVHTGRKTFATLSLEKGMSAEEVMTITGHKDYRSFKRYWKVTEQRKKAVMLKAWGKLKAV